MEAEKKEEKRGGVRAGAGRKRGDRTVPLNLRVSEEAAERLKEVPNKSKFVNDLILACGDSHE